MLKILTFCFILFTLSQLKAITFSAFKLCASNICSNLVHFKPPLGPNQALQ